MSDLEPPTAAIVSVGNELLYGQTVDTNAAWLGRALGDMGFLVVRRFTVGDQAADIQDAVASAIASAKLVLVSGGLGPTPDDRTKYAVASLFGRSLKVDAVVSAEIEARSRAQGLEEAPTMSRGQAEVPEGAHVLPNPIGTAPGLLIEDGGRLVVLLPGVPREMKEIFAGGLRSRLAELGVGRGTRVHHRVVHTTGISEPALAELVQTRLADIPDDETKGISLAYLPDERGVDLRLTTAAASSTHAAAMLDRLLSKLESVLGGWTFEAESGDLAEAVSRELRRRERTLAVAESCTGGLFAKRMTDIAGSSDVFVGGVVAYANEVKIEHVGVSADDLARYGAVSEEVVRQLASGVARRFGVDVGLGITGIAGPGGGSDEKPVGTVWIAVGLQGEVRAHRYRFSGNREVIRERATQAALAALYRRLTVP